MKNAYPIMMSQSNEYVIVYIPDFDINTKGKDYAEAIAMARDAIGLVGIGIEDNGKPLPTPSSISTLQAENSDKLVSLVDVDFAEYRRKNDMRTIRKNCTIPAWLSYEAEQAGINFSQVLQDALKKTLHIG